MDSTKLALSSHISSIKLLSTENAVLALSDLAPNLVASVSMLGVRLITHPKYTGCFPLNELGWFYLNLGRRLSTENCRLSARRECCEIYPYLKSLYEKTNEISGTSSVTNFMRSWREFTIACACCAGFPWYVLLDGRDSRCLRGNYFPEAVFNKIWDVQDGERMRGRSCAYNSVTGSMIHATREDLDAAIARGVDDIGEFVIHEGEEKDTKILISR